MPELNDTNNAPDSAGASAGAALGESVTFPSAAPAAIEKPLAQALPPDPHGWWWGTGRRKTAVARVRIKPGAGKFEIIINGKKRKTIDEYFSEARDRDDVVAPLKATNTFGKMDVSLRVDGGGFMGQAGAIKLGIARALKKYDPVHESTLRDHGYLTRDDRQVERKKPGMAGARKRFQFSKR